MQHLLIWHPLHARADGNAASRVPRQSRSPLTATHATRQVEADNAAAIRLYIAAGFRPAGGGPRRGILMMEHAADSEDAVLL